MSDQNTTVTADGLALMLDQFDGSVNLRLLAASFLDQAQQFEDDIWPLLGERALAAATGHRLDGLGQIADLARSGRDDAEYRLALTAEFAVLQSNGTAEELITIAQLMVQMGTAEYDVREYYPKGFYIRPVDHVLTVDPDLVGTMLDRAVSAATTMGFVYALQGDAATFQLSSQGATVETSSALGLSDFLWTEPWHYESLGTVLAGLLPGEFRFNNADPASATQIFVHDAPDGGGDASASLATLNGNALFLNDGVSAISANVSGVTDNTGTFTLDIAVVSVLGSFDDYDVLTWYATEAGGSLSGVR